MSSGEIKELCPVCTKQVGGTATIDPDKKVKIVWSKWCDECVERKTKGFILIGAVEDKTEDATNPYRSGNLWVVEQSVAEDVFKPNPPPASGVAFIDIKVAQAMKLPNVNMDA